MQQPTIDASRSSTSVSVSLLLSVAASWQPARTRADGADDGSRSLTTPAREVGEHLEYALILPMPTPPEPTPSVAPHIAPKRRGMPAIVLPKVEEDLPFTTDLLVPTPVVPDLPVAVLVDTIFPGEVSGESAPHLEAVGDPSGLAATTVASWRADGRPRTTSMRSRCRKIRNPCILRARCGETSSSRSPWSSSWIPPVASTLRRSSSPPPCRASSRSRCAMRSCGGTSDLPSCAAWRFDDRCGSRSSSRSPVPTRER